MGCVLIDNLGLGAGRIKGSEAKAQINDAVLNAAVLYAVVTQPPNLLGIYVLGGLLDQIITQAVAGIDNGKYYKQKDVDACVRNILSLFMLTDGFIAFALTCDMPEDPLIL